MVYFEFKTSGNRFYNMNVFHFQVEKLAIFYRVYYCYYFFPPAMINETEEIFSCESYIGYIFKIYICIFLGIDFKISNCKTSKLTK